MFSGQIYIIHEGAKSSNVWEQNINNAAYLLYFKPDKQTFKYTTMRLLQ